MLQCLFLLKNGEIWPPGPISQHGKSQGSWGLRGEMPAMVSRGTCSTTCRGLRLSLVFDTLPPGGILVGIPCSHVPPFHRDHAVGWGGLGERRDKKPGFLVGMGSVARAALPAIWVMLFELCPSSIPAQATAAQLTSSMAAECSSGLEYKSERGNHGASFF